jgi:2-C-methyl-D-erythritol 2,4-cyclodiphosphate synthase
MSDQRVGVGYDVHRLVHDRPLMLGGVRVPCELGLLGHSDADVLSHAICDALLGAAALGDIGLHFPDSDERYRGISSLRLLGEVVRLLSEAGYVPSNVDATVVAERPKLAPHLGAMRDALGGVLGLPVDRVGLKATTTEGLGPFGRGEGIAAMAVAVIVSVRDDEALIDAG